MTTSSASKQDRPDPRCPKCGFTMCQLFDERPVTALCVEATPNGKYQCYHCTPLAAQQATPPASPEPPPDDLVALVRALQAHAKEADWQDVDDPIQALLAWEPAASPVPVAPASSRPQERA